VGFYIHVAGKEVSLCHVASGRADSNEGKGAFGPPSWCSLFLLWFGMQVQAPPHTAVFPQGKLSLAQVEHGGYSSSAQLILDLGA